MWIQRLQYRRDGLFIVGKWGQSKELSGRNPQRTLRIVGSQGLTPTRVRAELLQQEKLEPSEQLVVEVANAVPSDLPALVSWLELSIDQNLSAAAAQYLVTHEVPDLGAWVQRTIDMDQLAPNRLLVTAARDLAFATMVVENERPFLFLRPFRMVVTHNLILLVWKRSVFADTSPASVQFVNPTCPQDVERQPSWPSEEEVAEQQGFWTVLDKDQENLLPTATDYEYPTVGDIAERYVYVAVESLREAAFKLTQKSELVELELMRATRTGQGEAISSELHGEALRCIALAVNLRGTLRRAVTPAAGGSKPLRWFPGATVSERALDIEKTVHEGLGFARNVIEDGREVLAACATIGSRTVLELQRAADERQGRFERNITLIGAIILGPTLVTGFFGANISVPGEDSWWGTILLLAAMAGSAILIYIVLRGLGKGSEG